MLYAGEGYNTIFLVNHGKVAWTDDPVLGLRYLDGVEAEQTRIGSSWYSTAAYFAPAGIF